MVPRPIDGTRPEHGDRGSAENRAEEDEEPAGMEKAGDPGAGDGARRRPELEEHCHAEVREPVADVGRRRPARGGDHRDDRRADGEPDVDPEQQRERGHHDHPAAEAEKRPEQARNERDRRDEEHEQQRCHEAKV